LRYVMCSDTRHEFSDGTVLSDTEDAFAYCYCPWQDVNCVNGTSADFCTDVGRGSNTSSDMEDTAIFSDGNEKNFTKGFVHCMGYDNCHTSEIGCTNGRWYLECHNGDDDSYDTWNQYIAWDLTEFDNLNLIKAYCSE